MNQSPSTYLPIAVTPGDLVNMVARLAGVTVFDVRTPAEYESAHIPGSHNVPLDELPRQARELGAAVAGPVVLVCRTGARARNAGDVLRAAVDHPVQVLDGGLVAWEVAGLPLTRGRDRWSMERQVRGVAGGVAMASAIACLFVWSPIGGIAAGIGGGLLLSALTGSCAMAKVLAKPPNNRGAGCDVGAVVRAIGGGATGLGTSTSAD